MEGCQKSKERVQEEDNDCKKDADCRWLKLGIKWYAKVYSKCVQRTWDHQRLKTAYTRNHSFDIQMLNTISRMNRRFTQSRWHH